MLLAALFVVLVSIRQRYTTNSMVWPYQKGAADFRAQGRLHGAASAGREGEEPVT